MKRGPNAGSTFLLEDDVTAVGRDPETAASSSTTSRSRASTRCSSDARSDGWFVRDVGSLNGTYVNGEQVDETKLASGDEVQIGKFKLTFFAAGE